MSEFNFDKLKNYEAPESWAQKAIKAANEQEKDRFYFFRVYRVAIVFACLILFCVISFTVCLQIIDDSIITPVNVEETTDSTKISHLEKQTENEYEIFAEDLTDEVEETKEKATEKEIQKPEQTQKPTQSSEKVKPTKKPQKEKETQNSENIESTLPYSEPTEKPIEQTVMCSTIIEKNKISENTDFYCRIYDCDDDIYLGDDDIFSSQHLAEIYGSSDSGVYVRYYPVKSGVITENGEYIVMFYDENGKNLKTFGFTVNEF